MYISFVSWYFKLVKFDFDYIHCYKENLKLLKNSCCRSVKYMGLKCVNNENGLVLGPDPVVSRIGIRIRNKSFWIHITVFRLRGAN